jgi:hypothetical protein
MCECFYCSAPFGTTRATEPVLAIRAVHVLRTVMHAFRRGGIQIVVQQVA